jgi:hypothetical protein
MRRARRRRRGLRAWREEEAMRGLGNQMSCAARRRVLLAVLGVVALALPAFSQERKAEVHGIFHGEPMYTVLPPDSIPAIREPSFLSGAAAAAQMAASEPVIGVVIGGEAHAYSAWQLDAHEIVNDRIGGAAIAATW